jgi:hypothetical protein
MNWKRAGAPLGLVAAVAIAVLFAWRGGPAPTRTPPASGSNGADTPPAAAQAPRPVPGGAVPVSSIVGPVASGFRRSEARDVVQPTPVAPRGLDRLRPEPVTCPPGGKTVGSPEPGGESYGCTIEDDAGRGVRVGTWWFWARDGKARTGAFKDGLIDGEWTVYYPDGKVAGRQQYKDGKQDGTWSDWDERGTLTSMRHFARGVLDGDSTVVFPDGTRRVETWRDGTLLETKTESADDAGNTPSATP